MTYNPISVDFTALSDFQLCPTFYMWRHLCGLKNPIDETPPAFGIGIHKGVQVYQSHIKGGADDTLADEMAFKTFDDLWDHETHEEYYKEKRTGKWKRKENGKHRGTAKAIFKAYKTFPSREEFRPLFPEQVKGREWFPGLEYVGRADQIGEHIKFGYEMGWDLKCHGNKQTANPRIDSMSKQYQGYCWLFEVDHWLVEHVAVRKANRDEVKTGKHRSGKDLELFNGYVVDVEKVEIVRNEGYIESILFELRDFKERLERYKEEMSFPRSDPYACTHFNSTCTYWKLCSQNVKPTKDFEVLDPEAQDFLREKWNPKGEK